MSSSGAAWSRCEKISGPRRSALEVWFAIVRGEETLRTAEEAAKPTSCWIYSLRGFTWCWSRRLCPPSSPSGHGHRGGSGWGVTDLRWEKVLRPCGWVLTRKNISVMHIQWAALVFLIFASGLASFRIHCSKRPFLYRRARALWWWKWSTTVQPSCFALPKSCSDCGILGDVCLNYQWSVS